MSPTPSTTEDIDTTLVEPGQIRFVDEILVGCVAQDHRLRPFNVKLKLSPLFLFIESNAQSLDKNSRTSGVTGRFGTSASRAQGVEAPHEQQFTNTHFRLRSHVPDFLAGTLDDLDD